MALDITTDEMRRWLASAPQTDRAIMVHEISHPEMSRVWYIWNEPYAGQVTTEDDETVDVLCCNVADEKAGTPANLDQVFTIVMDTTDVEDQFREELDRIPLGTEDRVSWVAREYLSSDLGAPQTVARLQVETLVCKRGSVVFTATSPRFNVTRTGMLYSPRDIPMLRAFV